MPVGQSSMCYREHEEKTGGLLEDPLPPWILCSIIFLFDTLLPPGAFSSRLQKAFLFASLSCPGENGLVDLQNSPWLQSLWTPLRKIMVFQRTGAEAILACQARISKNSHQGCDCRNFFFFQFCAPASNHLFTCSVSWLDIFFFNETFTRCIWQTICRSYLFSASKDSQAPIKSSRPLLFPSLFLATWCPVRPIFDCSGFYL